MMISNFLLSFDQTWFDFALLLGRLFIGICFVIHALGKLGLVGPGNMKGFEGWLKSLGVPMPAVQARLAMLCELLGGLMIATGFLMRFGCMACFATMAVAALIGHKGGGYLITNNPPGNEYTINLAAICVMFFLLGPGAYSLDAMIWI